VGQGELPRPRSLAGSNIIYPFCVTKYQTREYILSILCRQYIHTHTHTHNYGKHEYSVSFLSSTVLKQILKLQRKPLCFICLGNILLFTQCNWQQHFPVLKSENLTSINKRNKLCNEVQILREELKSRFQDIVGNVKHLSTNLHLHLKQKLWHPNEISNGVHTFTTQRTNSIKLPKFIFAVTIKTLHQQNISHSFMHTALHLYHHKDMSNYFKKWNTVILMRSSCVKKQL
jgi:hypothetical protein